jgi:glyoxylate utilization-related uncharacterized protein
MEPFIIDVHPAENQEYQLASHEGEEFLYVLQGKIEVLYGQKAIFWKLKTAFTMTHAVPHSRTC